MIIRVAARDSASRHCPHDAHKLAATRVLTCAHDEHTQQHIMLVLCGGDVVGKLWTGKPARRRAARRYESFGSGSTIFAAKPPTESRKNPPATGPPAAAYARARSSAPSAVECVERGRLPISGNFTKFDGSGSG